MCYLFENGSYHIHIVILLVCPNPVVIREQEQCKKWDVMCSSVAVTASVFYTGHISHHRFTCIFFVKINRTNFIVLMSIHLHLIIISALKMPSLIVVNYTPATIVFLLKRPLLVTVVFCVHRNGNKCLISSHLFYVIEN